MKAHWEHFSHAADMGLRGYGDSKAQAFEQMALALTATVTEPERVAPLQSVDIVCQYVVSPRRRPVPTRMCAPWWTPRKTPAWRTRWRGWSRVFVSKAEILCLYASRPVFA